VTLDEFQQLVWPKYPNALLSQALRLSHEARFRLNFTALSPILILHRRRLGRDERGMDWKKLLGSITESGDEELRLRVVFQICTLPMQSVNPNSYRLTNNPTTMSCIWTDVENRLVLRTSRLIRVRQVRGFRSLCGVLRVPG